MAIPTRDRAPDGGATKGAEAAGRPNRFELSLFTPLLARATRDVVSQLDQPCLLVSSDDLVRYANPSFLETMGIDGRIDGRSLFEIAGGGFDTPAFRDRLAFLRSGGRVHGWQLEGTFPTVGAKVLSIDLVSIRGAFFETGLTVMAMRDETARVLLEDDIARKTHEEADLATRLTRLRAAETPSVTARRILDEMAMVPGFDFLALCMFGTSHQLMPVALTTPSTAPFAVGRPLPIERSRYLRQRALAGPWIETWPGSEDGSATIGDAGQMLPGMTAAAYAPIHGPTSVVGILIMASSSRAAADRINDHFPALLSFAAIAGALLGPVQERHNEQVAARAEIHSIMAEEAFEPVFQSIVELGTGRIVGYEALTRFTDGVSPAERFAEASLLGIGPELEMACARRALDAAKELPEGMWIGVNASPSMVLDTAELGAMLIATNREVVLEITEHAAVADYPALHRAIASLGHAVRVAVDDAGAGYADLQRILELRAHFVKLDLTLVRGVDMDPARQALVAGMSHFVRRTDARLIAEGVESRAEARALLDLGVELGQGYLFGRPERAGIIGHRASH